LPDEGAPKGFPKGLPLLEAVIGAAPKATGGAPNPLNMEPELTAGAAPKADSPLPVSIEPLMKPPEEGAATGADAPNEKAPLEAGLAATGAAAGAPPNMNALEGTVVGADAPNMNEEAAGAGATTAGAAPKENGAALRLSLESCFTIG
jgi:hypothetical protein